MFMALLKGYHLKTKRAWQAGSLPLAPLGKPLNIEIDNRYMEIFYKKLTHVIMEVEKSHDLASENCRPRKAGGIVPI